MSTGATPECLQGILVRTDRLPVGPAGSMETVDVLQPRGAETYVARWYVDGADRVENLRAAAADSLLVTLRRDYGPESLKNVFREMGLPRVERVEGLPLPRTFSLRSSRVIHKEGPQTYLLAYLDIVRQNPTVERADPDYYYFGIPTAFSLAAHRRRLAVQDELELIRATEVWQAADLGKEEVRIGVLDSGIDLDHPYLEDNICRDEHGKVVGGDFENDTSDGNDDANGHGTFCAGLIGASAASGVAVFPTAKLMPLKFYGPSGCGTVTAAIKAIDFGVKHGATVLSASWGSYACSQYLRDAIARADDAGVLFVAGAGNDKVNIDSNPFYPGSFALDNVICVGGSDDNDEPMLKLNHGAKSVHLCAPAHSIYSTVPAGSVGPPFEESGGTSASTAFVAGACGMVIAAKLGLSHHQVRERIIKTVASLKGKRVEIEKACCSRGRLDVANAVLHGKLDSGVKCP